MGSIEWLCGGALGERWLVVEAGALGCMWSVVVWWVGCHGRWEDKLVLYVYALLLVWLWFTLHWGRCGVGVVCLVHQGPCLVQGLLVFCGKGFVCFQVPSLSCIGMRAVSLGDVVSTLQPAVTHSAPQVGPIV